MAFLHTAVVPCAILRVPAAHLATHKAPFKTTDRELRTEPTCFGWVLFQGHLAAGVLHHEGHLVIAPHRLRQSSRPLDPLARIIHPISVHRKITLQKDPIFPLGRLRVEHPCQGTLFRNSSLWMLGVEERVGRGCYTAKDEGEATIDACTTDCPPKRRGCAKQGAPPWCLPCYQCDGGWRVLQARQPRPSAGVTTHTFAARRRQY